MSTGISKLFWYITFIVRIIGISYTGADPGFQARGGGALKKIAPSRGRRENIWGNLCEKSRFYAKKNIFLPILRGRAPGAPPPEFAPDTQRSTPLSGCCVPQHSSVFLKINVKGPISIGNGKSWGCDFWEIFY